jgi:16S rRNA C967 or C1407 C5-methylase (RsmB/RsmF family)
LQIEPKNRILELCCAPGNKSMLMADSHDGVSITGVEISVNRANIMKNLVKKYGLEQQIKIVTEDGLKYDSSESFDRVLVDAECTHEGSLKHIHKFFKE